MYHPRRSFVLGLAALTIGLKVLPYVLIYFGLDVRSIEGFPWGITSVFAIGIFGVGMFRDLRLAFGLPAVCWIASDVLIGVVTYSREQTLFLANLRESVINAAILLASLAPALLIRKQRSWGTIAAASLLTLALFFVASNSATWLIHACFPQIVTDPIGYEPTFAGWVAALAAGVPFINKYQILSTVCFTGLLFSPLGMEQLKRAEPAPATAATPQPAA